MANELEHELKARCKELNIVSYDEFPLWRKEEEIYLRERQGAVIPERAEHEMKYVEMLRKMESA